LQSRYYDPVICRFLNSDDLKGLSTTFGNVIGANDFIYCLNNPVMYVDYDGTAITPVPTGGNYYVNKAGIQAAGAAYLTTKGYNLSRNMYNHGFYPSLYALDTTLLRNKVFGSLEFNNLINMFRRSFNKSLNASINFTSGDLHYAVGRMNVSLSKIGNTIIATASDIYDFTEWYAVPSFSNLANNIGYLVQKNKWLTPYYWQISKIIV
jgi:hypothetical protein